MLEVQGLTFAYRDSRPVVRDLDLSLKPREIVALLGASGCGKSTVLRLVAGLLPPSAGTVAWTTNKPDIGYVFQDAALMPWTTIAKNIALPLELGGQNLSGKETETLLEIVGLSGLSDRYPQTLSGGQRMRVSIARAIAANPDVLLMDEPFAALDEILRFKMNELILNLRAERGWAGLFVTHSLYEAAYLADRILVMKDGAITGQITPQLDRHASPEDQRTSEAFVTAVRSVSDLMAGVDAA